MAPAWRIKEEGAAAAAAAQSCYVLAADVAGDGGSGMRRRRRRIPKGYVPMALVGDEEDGGGEEERVLVHVRMLREPCMAALLEMAAEQFGHGQRGVLRIPCNRRQFQQMVSVMCIVQSQLTATTLS